MKQRGEKVLRNSPWVAVAVLTAALVAVAAAGRSEAPGPAASDDDALAASAHGTTANAVAEKAINVVETTMAGESIPPAAESRATDSGIDPIMPSGVRAFIDPETGELTANPTRAQLQSQVVERRASALSRSTTGLRPFELSRGGRGLNLQGRFQTAMRVERAADGSFHVTCGDGHEEGHSHDHSEPTAAVPVQ